MDKAPEAFRTISEVADWLGVQPHVLRFWESKFPQIKPVKRAGGRRYYRPNDMLLLGGLRKLLHEDGLTIKGAQKVLREQGVRAVQAMSPPLDDDMEHAGADDLDAGTEADEQMADEVVEAAAPVATPAAPPAPPNGEAVQASFDLPEIRKRPRPRDLPDPVPLAPQSPVDAAASHTAELSFDPAPAETPSADLPIDDALPVGSDAEDVVAGVSGASASDMATAAAPVHSDAPEQTADFAEARDDTEETADGPPDTDAPVTAADPVPAFRSRLSGMIAGETPAPPNGPTASPSIPAAPALPSADLPLDEALSMLSAGQVPAIRLRPIFEQMVALRDRMEAAP